jgi:hypothetical protein
VFDGLGNVVNPAEDLTINVKNSTAACATVTTPGLRCLRIAVAQSGQVRMCDPVATAGDPRQC